METHSSILAWRIPTDRGAWWATVHGVTKSWTQLNDKTQHSISVYSLPVPGNLSQFHPYIHSKRYQFLGKVELRSCLKNSRRQWNKMVNMFSKVLGGNENVFLFLRICLQCRRPGFNPQVGKIPWRRAWPPTPLFLPGESPWTEKPGGLQSMESQRVGHN